MMALTELDDPGLVVLPTHRVAHSLSPAQLGSLSSRLGEYFEVLAAADSPSPKAIDSALAEIQRSPRRAFVLYGPLPSGLRVIALKPEWLGQTFDTEHGEAWNRLDVSILHSVIGGKVLGLSAEDMASQRHFSYTRDPEEAVRAVQTGQGQIALLLNPTPPTAIRDVALARDRMPQKSTYFYPKLATGMVINPLN
jgi:hypothetical protein